MDGNYAVKIIVILSFLQLYFIFLEMGNGWGPAVINSQQEYDFIKEGQKGFFNSISYWIGGSTDNQTDDIFNYTYYISDNTGKI